jgi:inosose dehydratase
MTTTSAGWRVAVMLRAIPKGYDGDFMIEINEPSVDCRFESHQIAYQWAQLNLSV